MDILMTRRLRQVLEPAGLWPAAILPEDQVQNPSVTGLVDLMVPTFPHPKALLIGVEVALEPLPEVLGRAVVQLGRESWAEPLALSLQLMREAFRAFRRRRSEAVLLATQLLRQREQVLNLLHGEGAVAPFWRDAQSPYAIWSTGRAAWMAGVEAKLVLYGLVQYKLSGPILDGIMRVVQASAAAVTSEILGSHSEHQWQRLIVGLSWWRARARERLAFEMPLRASQLSGRRTATIGTWPPSSWQPPTEELVTRRGTRLGRGDLIQAGDQGRTRLDPDWLPIPRRPFADFLDRVRAAGGLRIWNDWPDLQLAEWQSYDDWMSWLWENPDWLEGFEEDDGELFLRRYDVHEGEDGEIYREPVEGYRLTPMPDPTDGLDELAYWGAHAGFLWEAKEFQSGPLETLLREFRDDADLMNWLGVRVIEDWNAGDDGFYWLVEDESRLRKVAKILQKLPDDLSPDEMVRRLRRRLKS